MAIDTTSQRTRRAILLGALGGVAASVATAVGGASPVAAHDPDDVRLGSENQATDTTGIDMAPTAPNGVTAFYASARETGDGIVGHAYAGRGVLGHATSGIGVEGESPAGTGTRGSSTSGSGVTGNSSSGYGVAGNSTSNYGVYGGSAKSSGVFGIGYAKTGVQGYSGGFGKQPAAPAQTGVFGYANQGTSAVGVKGQSPVGRGVVAAGGKAQLRLVPSSAATHPTSGAAGDLFLDKNKRLWLCKGGSTWKQIA